MLISRNSRKYLVNPALQHMPNLPLLPRAHPALPRACPVRWSGNRFTTCNQFSPSCPALNRWSLPLPLSTQVHSAQSVKLPRSLPQQRSFTCALKFKDHCTSRCLRRSSTDAVKAGYFLVKSQNKVRSRSEGMLQGKCAHRTLTHRTTTWVGSACIRVWMPTATLNTQQNPTYSKKLKVKMLIL